MEIKKHSFVMIGKNCLICHIPTWGSSEDKDYIYAVAVATDDSIEREVGWDIFGFGKNLEEALILAVKQLAEEALTSIPLEILKDFSFSEFINMINSKKGEIPYPKITPQAKLDAIPISQREHMGSDQGFKILIKENIAIPFIE